MSKSFNPFKIIMDGIVKVFEIVFSKIKMCKSSCCQSECTTKGRTPSPLPFKRYPDLAEM